MYRQRVVDCDAGPEVVHVVEQVDGRVRGCDTRDHQVAQRDLQHQRALFTGC